MKLQQKRKPQGRACMPLTSPLWSNLSSTGQRLRFVLRFLVLYKYVYVCMFVCISLCTKNGMSTFTHYKHMDSIPRTVHTVTNLKFWQYTETNLVGY